MEKKSGAKFVASVPGLNLKKVLIIYFVFLSALGACAQVLAEDNMIYNDILQAHCIH